ncbi:hypothetical protein IV203_027996 [Nitzschia inconspicua]|uniref:Uncharacterized protein n=1 Tax=Nitzschia inconspicua TaxID=303405 RepID=A0A9K3LXF3_9STRA|nr:hypothetical protein IV203_027996 [Nitzschia inconspicua]
MQRKSLITSFCVLKAEAFQQGGNRNTPSSKNMGCEQSTPVAVGGGTRHVGTASRARTKHAERNTMQSFGSIPHTYGFYDATLYGGEAIALGGGGHWCDTGGFGGGGDCGGGFGGGSCCDSGFG